MPTNELDASNAKKTKKKDKRVNEEAMQLPEHTRNLAFILRNNSEIRRFTSVGIINYLQQKGVVHKGVEFNHFVLFKWNKFQIITNKLEHTESSKTNKLIKEYEYTEPFFLNSLVASFTCFSTSAQRTVNTFVHTEMSVGSIQDVVDMNEVNSIIDMIAETQNEDEGCEE